MIRLALILLLCWTAAAHAVEPDEMLQDKALEARARALTATTTASNICPARFMFVRSPEAKARLEPYLDEGNRPQTMAAPWTAIVAYDLDFVEQLPKLIPHAPNAKDWFADPKNVEWNAIQSGTLQGAYFMIAARALGLDCGPMSGFDNAGVDREFFAGTSVKSNFLCSIGYGTDENLFPRSPRLAFDAAFVRGTPVAHRGVLEGKADFYYLGHGLAGLRRLFEVNDTRRRTQAALLVFSVAYNLLAVGLAAFGHMSPLLAAILMPVSSLLTLAIVGAGMRKWLRI